MVEHLCLTGPIEMQQIQQGMDVAWQKALALVKDSRTTVSNYAKADMCLQVKQKLILFLALKIHISCSMKPCVNSDPPPPQQYCEPSLCAGKLLSSLRLRSLRNNIKSSPL